MGKLKRTKELKIPEIPKPMPNHERQKLYRYRLMAFKSLCIKIITLLEDLDEYLPDEVKITFMEQLEPKEIAIYKFALAGIYKDKRLSQVESYK